MHSLVLCFFARDGVPSCDEGAILSMADVLNVVG